MKDQKIVTYFNPKSPIAEAYRTLRTNIQFSSLDKSIKTLLVTSAGPGEGKSTTLANYAITMAQAGQQVIIVDCDLRKPRQHKIFGLDNSKGLTNIMVDNLKIELALQPTLLENLKLLSTGPIPPNPAELLASERMKNFIEEIQTKADIVLFDSPPIVAVTDAALLGSRVDGVLMVLKAGEVNREMALRAKEALEHVKARIIGTVLNSAEINTEDSYYYYYGEKKTKAKECLER